jgi:hypothetical protein
VCSCACSMVLTVFTQSTYVSAPAHRPTAAGDHSGAMPCRRSCIRSFLSGYSSYTRIGVVQYAVSINSWGQIEAHQRLGTVPPAARASITPVSRHPLSLSTHLPSGNINTGSLVVVVVVAASPGSLRCCWLSFAGVNVRAVARHHLAITAPVGCSRASRSAPLVVHQRK